MIEKTLPIPALVSLLCLFPGHADSHFMHVRNGCQNVDYDELGKSVVALKFIYDTPTDDGVIGHVGTAWFLTPTLLATVSHVTHDMFEEKEWREVEVGWGDVVREPLDTNFPLLMRYHSTHTTGLTGEDGLPEDVVLLEIRARIAGRSPAKVRYSPIQKNEPVVAIGYLGLEQRLQWAAGHYSPPEQTSEESDPEAEPLQPFLYFEMTNEKGKNRHVLDHGTSGSPVFDCDGEVVAIINGIITTELEHFPSFTTDSNGDLVIDNSTPMRVTPSIGHANNTALPVTVIDEVE